MTPQNLAVVFAPNLLRTKDQGADMQSITSALMVCMCVFIELCPCEWFLLFYVCVLCMRVFFLNFFLMPQSFSFFSSLCLFCSFFVFLICISFLILAPLQDTPYSLQLMAMFIENYPLVFEDNKILSQVLSNMHMHIS